MTCISPIAPTGEVVSRPSMYSFPPDSTCMTARIQRAGTSNRAEAWRM